MYVSAYPLTQFNSGLLLNFPRNEKIIFETNRSQINRNTIAYLHNNQRDSKRMYLNQCEASISIRPVLQKLICSTEIELNSDEFICYINKVNIISYIKIRISLNGLRVIFFIIYSCFIYLLTFAIK